MAERLSIFHKSGSHHQPQRIDLDIRIHLGWEKHNKEIDRLKKWNQLFAQAHSVVRYGWNIFSIELRRDQKNIYPCALAHVEG